MIILGGAEVRCTDGVCGVVGRVFLDRSNRALTYLAVEPHGLSVIGRLVPFALLRGSENGIDLCCTQEEFRAAEPDADAHLELVAGARPGETHAAPIILDRVPDGTVEVNSDTSIRATDGVAGRLQGVVIDDHVGTMTALVLEIGHFSKKRLVTIPTALLTAINPGEFDLNLTRAEVEGF